MRISKMATIMLRDALRAAPGSMARRPTSRDKNQRIGNSGFSQLTASFLTNPVFQIRYSTCLSLSNRTKTTWSRT